MPLKLYQIIQQSSVATYSSEYPISESITIHLTYYQIMTKEIKTFMHLFLFTDLQAFFEQLVKEYLLWYGIASHHTQSHDQFIKLLTFPYPLYRAGNESMQKGHYYRVKNALKDIYSLDAITQNIMLSVSKKLAKLMMNIISPIMKR